MTDLYRERVRVTKMHGTGNDFLLIDLRSPSQEKLLQSNFGPLNRAGIAKRLCQRRLSIGADGLAFLLQKETNAEVDFKWEFFNADGSMAEMCGNAARCVALYAYKNGITTQSLKFETCAGVIEAQVENDERINVLMPPLKSADWKQTHSLNVETSLDVDVLNTGVPHWVIQVPSLAHTDPLRVTAQQLKQTQDFPTEGANITFWSIVGPNSIHSISYERGVNDFTLACGTGAMASAYAFRHHHKGLSLIPVQVPGGLLSVDLSGDRPHLIGPAEFVADLYCYPNLLKTP